MLGSVCRASIHCILHLACMLHAHLDLKASFINTEPATNNVALAMVSILDHMMYAPKAILLAVVMTTPGELPPYQLPDKVFGNLAT